MDQKDWNAVREKFLQSDIVAVTQLDGSVKIVKHRFSFQGTSWTVPLYEAEIQRCKALNPHRDIKVWRLDYYEAQELLKGRVAL